MIHQFLEKISAINSGVDFENLYFGSNPNAIIRRNNLKCYLELMNKITPNIILVGEAPGYKGCKLTGIPFTSESILYSHSFFSQNDFQFINSKDSLETENSATIFWNELDKYEKTPLIWNIFPFHPFPKDKPNKNRTPNINEMTLGKDFLLLLIQMFKIGKIGAVGRQAESMLKDIDINIQYIRHPSYGGKSKFIEGIKNIMTNA